MSSTATPRERTEEYERSRLAPWAARSAETKGRERFEPSDTLRTPFQIDRDRILSSAAFAALGGKTHRFVPSPQSWVPRGWRTRLARATDVLIVARTLARALRLNEDLTEAIVLGRDLGQPAFGSAGEAALAGLTDPPFRHDEQSLRIVEVLEEGGEGLNLTWETRDGILHSAPGMPSAATVEGRLVELADRITAVAYDLPAAIRAGLVSRDELDDPRLQRFGGSAESWGRQIAEDVLAASGTGPDAEVGPEAAAVLEVVSTLLAERVYAAAGVAHEVDRGVHVLSSLVVFYREVPERLPGEPGATPVEQRVIDVVAGLDDAGALAAFDDCFVPRRRPA